MDSDNGKVVWITGYSGVGKSTIARRVQRVLGLRGREAVLLDGDEVRAAVADPGCGHDRVGRIANAYRIARLARLLASQGALVIVATMSLYHEVHEWNREHLPGYLEVLLEADLDVLRQRDPKGLYRAVECGTERNLCGFDLEAEPPARPHLRIRNDGGPGNIPEVADFILRNLGPGLAQRA